MSPADPDSQRLLLQVAEEIADARPVSWDEHTSEFTDPELRARFGNLRMLERLALAFRAGAPSAAAAPGKRAPVLFTWGHLEAREKLGEGGFGEVYRAYDPVLDREVALKLRKRGPSRQGTGGRRYIREARRLARLRHPHVISVHGADEHDGRVGFWTDLIDGQTLADVVRVQGPLSAEEALSVGRVICSALAAVHGAKLVHGDVKPSNVMRERGGRYVLMDLGAASLMRTGAEVEWVEQLQGTPLAMAPELLGGAAPAAAADIYSLGVLLYYLVSGAYPVRAKSFDELVTLHRDGERMPLRDRRPDLPEAFVDVVERALDREPQARFESAGAMEQALARATEGIQEAPWAMRWRPGHWSWAAAAGLIAAGTLTAWMLLTAPRDRDLATAGDGCVSHEQCTDDHSGQPYICPQPGGVCVSLLTPDCTRVIGDWTHDDPIFFGTLYYMSGGFVGEAVADAQECGFDQAVDDLYATIGGIPGPDGNKRSFVGVMCDERGDVEAPMTHLADDIGVGVVFGTLEQESTLAAMDVLQERDVLMMSTHLGTPPLEVLEDSGLHWSVLPSDSLSVRGLDGYLDRIEAMIRAASSPPDKIRVALVTGESGVDTTIGDFIVNADMLTFNGGVSAASNASDTDPAWCPLGCFRRFNYRELDPAQLPLDLLDYDPHIVVVQAGTTAFSAGGMPKLEEQLGEADPGRSGPIYLYHFPDPTPLMYAAGRLGGKSPADPNIAERLFANLAAVGAPQLLEKFWVNFTDHCPDSVPPRSPIFPPNQWNNYDALFLVAFAYLANGNHRLAATEIGGSHIRDGLAHLSPGGQSDPDSAVTVGLGNPLDWQRAVSTLLQGNEIDLEGVVGSPLDFDIDTGFVTAGDYQLGCPSSDLTRWIPSGVRWSDETGQVAGTITECP